MTGTTAENDHRLYMLCNANFRMVVRNKSALQDSKDDNMAATMDLHTIVARESLFLKLIQPPSSVHNGQWLQLMTGSLDDAKMADITKVSYGKENWHQRMTNLIVSPSSHIYSILRLFWSWVLSRLKTVIITRPWLLLISIKAEFNSCFTIHFQVAAS